MPTEVEKEVTPAAPVLPHDDERDQRPTTIPPLLHLLLYGFLPHSMVFHWSVSISVFLLFFSFLLCFREPVKNRRRGPSRPAALARAPRARALRVAVEKTRPHRWGGVLVGNLFPPL